MTETTLNTAADQVSSTTDSEAGMMTTLVSATEREQNRKRLQDIMLEHDLSKEEIADMLHISVSAVVAWLKPETSKSSNPVPMWALELLAFKLANEQEESDSNERV